MNPGEFARCLGPVTFDVWVALIWRRDREGVTYARIGTISTAKNLSNQQVMRACSRLRQAGLLQPLGWVEGSKTSTKKYARKVFGDYREGQVTMSPATKRRIKVLPKRGGARPGAGRPKKNQTDSKETPEKNQTDSKETCGPNGPSSNSNRCDPLIKPIGPRIQSDTHKNIELKRSKISLKRNLRSQAPANFSFFKFIEEVPYPSTLQIGVAKLPPPTMLPDAPDLEKIKILLAAFRGAIETRIFSQSERRSGKRCWLFTRGNIEKSKHWPMLLAASCELCDKGISPMSWAAWSCDKWSELNSNAGKKKIPPIGWIFSHKRITQHASWFDREAGSYGGGRLFFAEEHKRLLQRYDGFRRDMKKTIREKLIANEEATIDDAEALVEKHFPGGWKKYYETAQEATSRDQAELFRQVERGEFVW